MERAEIEHALLRARGLTLLRGVLDSPASREFLSLLELLAAERPDPAAVAETFGRLWRELAVSYCGLLPDAWQSHLVERLLEDENTFSLAAERGEVGLMVLDQVRIDLSTLGLLSKLDSRTLLGHVEEAAPELSGLWALWTDPSVEDDGSPRSNLARKLAAAGDWGGCAELLTDHFARHGAGDFGRHRAFRWKNGGLAPVERPDPVSLAGLVGYEGEREPLLANTERFLEGLPARHALIYGPSGTGKSSTVKAVANEHAGRGLRLVEIAREELGELPALLDALRGRGLRFIVFVDDLSFEENESGYKTLKALLEGTVEEPPENVLLYATSNRRNLVRESFSEREDEVHARDTEREKQSLAARFGLRLTFLAPDQERFLEMVSGLCRHRGLKVPDEALKERALAWDQWQQGRSGRAARQLADEIEAELSRG